jgi:hypothetical protein
MRKCFWLREHDWRGRLRHLRALGLRGRMLKAAHNPRGARGTSPGPAPFNERSATPACDDTVSWFRLILRSPCHKTAAFNRRMRKTARPVVWEG